MSFFIPLNALCPMSVTLSGMEMSVIPVQPLKAPEPMLVTLSDIATFVIPLHPANV